MKLYLDDERTPPEGWTLVRWPAEAIERMDAGGVTEISLDHDLANVDSGGKERTGYDVLLWLEQRAFEGGDVPRIHIHTANPVARQRMMQARDRILQRLEARE